MARKRGGGGRGKSENPMNMMIMIAIGVLVLIAVFMFIPYVASTIESSTPAAPSGSDWNETENTDLPNPAELWTTVAGLLILCVVALVIAIAIMYFKNMGK